MKSWFKGRQFPLGVGVAFWLDGAPAGPRVASRLTASGDMCAGLGPALRRLAGKTVWGLRLAAAAAGGAAGKGGRAELDILLTSPARGGGASSGGGRGGGEAETAGAAGGPLPRGQRQEPEAAAVAAAVAAAAAAAPTPTTRFAASVQQPHSGASPVPARGAPAAPSRPAAPMPAAMGPASGVVGAALQALRLPDIALLPAVAGDDPLAAATRASLENAAQAVFDQAERVADALGLSLAEADDVLAGVAWATAEAGRCRRFVGMEYGRLRRACCGGDDVMARSWCERVAAAGRSAA
jgi:hypothetical protein